MNEIPWTCHACGHEQMVDFDALPVRPIDKIVSARGFVCGTCGRWEAISYSNSSLEEIMRKLKRYVPGQQKYAFLLFKAIQRARSLRQRGECNGSRKHPHVVAPGPVR